MARGYAVVDVETTGLAAHGSDRVVEVAVVHLDLEGSVTGEWCTLVNPARDLGPQRIHRITAAEVRHAPSFHRIAGALAGQLAGRVLVAHNLGFDARFLAAEFDRAGVRVPVAAEAGLCTMRLADHYLPDRAGRSLRACCDAAGVSLTDAHSALHDAHAAAALFAGYLRSAGRPEPWSDLLHDAASTPWPRLPPDEATLVRRGEAVGPRFLGRVSAELIGLRLRRDDLVVFTGEMAEPRDVLVARALASGLRVNSGYVTRQTRLLVAADPDSLSSKARRAQAYGVPIVTEDGFDRMLAAMADGIGRKDHRTEWCGGS
ncbi:hypothetical protein F0L68_25885 [Solihabitans fulvus]|uniref:Exonuclease domain-containing protein n=1 Tax=Solihabitans fulvus TaxID=1892852 RepID=A0A5B2X0M0_9PSEU|nr:exonuclease domain-containing protein [Solihabitans fulvus]KAA2256930.1 hypothetical protein F0L68_25885 [Solihabitans fulvus]